MDPADLTSLVSISGMQRSVTNQHRLSTQCALYACHLLSVSRAYDNKCLGSNNAQAALP